MRKLSVVSLVVCLFALSLAAQPKPPTAPCFGNVLQNGNFSAGLKLLGNGSMPGSSVTGWTTASRDPQLVATGCGNPGFVAMWGNQVVGEAIQQKLSAPLTKGRPYRFSACVKFANPSPAGPVRVKVRASSGPLGGYTAAGSLIGVTKDVTSTDWVLISLPSFTPTASNLDTITINPENGSAVNHGSAVSWVHIDNACLQPADLPSQEKIVLGDSDIHGTLASCKFKDGVTIDAMADALTNFSYQCQEQWCFTRGGGSTCVSEYKHSEVLWEGNRETVFTAAQQNAFKLAAQTIGDSHTELCGDVKKSVLAYEFKAVERGMGPHANKGLAVTVHYGVCTKAKLPN